MLYKIIGIWLVIDGGGSLLCKKLPHDFLFDAGRIVRVVIGVVLVCLS